MASPRLKITIDRIQNGISLAAMNWTLVIGVTLSCSSVPSSFSRVMFCAVSRSPMIVVSETMSAGTIQCL